MPAMKSVRPLLLLLLISLILPVASGGAAAAAADADSPAAVARLDVGAAAPSWDARGWLNGRPMDVPDAAEDPVTVLTFWATWSGPSRAALAGLAQLDEEYRQRGVRFVGVTDESLEAVEAYVRQRRPRLDFRIMLDDDGATRAAYCPPAGVDFLPYTFLIASTGEIAWHGHPQQPELVLMLEQLLDGSYDAARARTLVRKARSVAQLERLFREAHADSSWRAAIMALDNLLELDVPPQRPLRYKLSILIGEMQDRAAARKLMREILAAHGDDPSFLNRLAWDVLSDERLYAVAPDIGWELARAAYGAAPERADIADTYARALHMIGRLADAVRVQKQAVAAAEPDQKSDHAQTLAFYDACLKLHEAAARASQADESAAATR
jgi:thiol-disulfide isomerase/thioredoxin